MGTYYDKDDYARMDYIIKIIGEKGRATKTDYVVGLVEQAHPKQTKHDQEKYVYYDSMIDRLVHDLQLLRINKTLIELTEEGIELYDEGLSVEKYIQNQREEKRLSIEKLRLEKLHLWILIISSLGTILFSTLGYIVGGLWGGILRTATNVSVGALLAIAFQLVKPIINLLNSSK